MNEFKPYKYTRLTQILIILIIPFVADAQICDGGMISSNSGDTVDVCIDGQADIINFDSTNVQGAEYAYVVTDANDTILALPPSDMADFEPAGPGECHVYGVAYEGNLMANMGTHISSISATTCSDLTSNYLVIYRDTVDGGTVETITGQDSVYACIDGMPDIYQFITSSATQPSNYQWIVTDAQDNILALPPANMADFEPAGPGECHVFGAAFLGDLNASPGMNVDSITATECLDISSNFITVLRDTIVGGEVETTNNQDTVYACIDGMPDVYSFMTNSPTNANNYQWIVTDAQDNILALPPANMADFEPAGPGECHIFGVAFLGNLNASAGMNIDSITASGCLSTSSNFIVVHRDTMDGGVVTDSNGEDTVTIFVDGNPDIINFMSSSVTASSNYQYVITNAEDTILGLPPSNMANFEPAGVGECHVYGFAYLGEFLGGPGQHISELSASECFELSSGYLVVERIDSTTSTSQSVIVDEHIKAYPIPANNLINLEFESNKITQADLIISGLSGKQFIRERRTILHGQNTWQVILPESLKGTFQLSIRSPEQSINRLIIIQ